MVISCVLILATSAAPVKTASNHDSAWPPFSRTRSVQIWLTVAIPSKANPNGVGELGSQLLTSKVPVRGTNPKTSWSENETTCCHAEPGGATCADAGGVTAIATMHPSMPTIASPPNLRMRFMIALRFCCRCEVALRLAAPQIFDRSPFCSLRVFGCRSPRRPLWATGFSVHAHPADSADTPRHPHAHRTRCSPRQTHARAFWWGRIDTQHHMTANHTIYRMPPGYHVYGGARD